MTHGGIRAEIFDGGPDTFEALEQQEVRYASSSPRDRPNFFSL